MLETDEIIEDQPRAPETLAKVKGQAVTELPKDLYIPPEALEVFLDAFEGPLDLLLYLIKKQNLDVLDIPIAEITRQYMDYVELMRHFQLELAAEYLVMAAMLAEIKSRMLLPRPIDDNTDENDPRAELIRRLQEYERIKQAAEDIDNLPRLERDIFPVYDVPAPAVGKDKPLPSASLRELILSLRDVYERAKLHTQHLVTREALSTRERMTQILNRIKAEQFTDFSELFDVEEGRPGVIVTFLAILELVRLSMIELVQAEAYAKIHVTAVE